MEQIVRDFLEMVKIGAASGDERKIADYMKSHLEALGCEVFEDDAGAKVGGNAGNVFAYFPGEIEGCLLLSAHMDRVSNGYVFRPSIVDGEIVSDGTTFLGADDVSGLAVILDAVRRIKAGGIRHVTLEIVLSICEENGILGARLMDLSRLRSQMGYIMDTTGPLGQLDIKRPYKAMIDVEVLGKRAHGGSPEKGINAIAATCQMLTGIREGRLDFESTSNIGVIHGGPKEPGTVCDRVLVRCEARSVQQEKLMNYLRYFENYCREHIKGTGAELRFQYEIQHGNVCFCEDDEVVKLAAEELKHMGVEPQLSLTMEGCDGYLFCAHGIPCISVGMGNSNAHALNEKVNVEQLIQSGELTERLILSYSQKRELREM